MNNLSYAFGAFALVTLVFFIHSWIMSSKQSRLEKKLDELREQVRERHGSL